MIIAVDVILALLGGVIIIRCAVKGFIMSIFGMLKLLASVAASYIFAPSIFNMNDTASRLVGYLLVFFGTYLVLTIIAVLLDRICRLPVLNAANKLLGAALGVVCAYITVSAAAALITLIYTIAGSGGLFGINGSELAAQTVLYRFFCDNGLFTIF